MTPTVSQLLSWQPGELGDAGEELLGQAESLHRAGGDLVLVGAGMQSVWLGQAADVAVAHTGRRVRELDELAAVVHSTGQALVTLAAVIAAAQRRLHEALAAAAAAGMGVTDDGAVTPPVLPLLPSGLVGPDLDPAQQQHDRAAEGNRRAAGLATLIAAALSTAGGADYVATAALTGLTMPTVSPAPQPGVFDNADFTALLRFLLPGMTLPTPDEVRAAVRGPLPGDVMSLELLLRDARAAGLAPIEYAQVLEAYWRAKALQRAGIDKADWDPGLGVDHNRDNVLKVYEYYKTLYRLDPTLEWAGLANLVGPGFAAGFEDLGGLRDLARAVSELPGPPPPGMPPGVEDLAGASDSQLRFFESTFLSMQKRIFLDIGGMHEAYLSGQDGMENLREMAAAGLIDNRTMRAWDKVAEGSRTGSAQTLRAGAVGMADHEQNHVIAEDWDRMREHAPVGDAVTYLMTVVGKPSVPGAHFPGQVRPRSVPVTPDLPDRIDFPDLPQIGPWDPPDLPDLPLPQEVVVLVTPLPDFNVSQRIPRFDYFLKDTMPAYDHLVDEPGHGTLDREMARPLIDRIGEQRALVRSPDVLEQFSPEHWHVRIDR